MLVKDKILRSFIAALFIFLSTPTAFAAHGSAIGPRAIGRAVISLVIPPHINVTGSAAQNITLQTTQNGAIMARMNLCMQSNLSAPIEVTADGQTATNGAVTCGNGNTGEDITTTLDASKGNLVYMTVEPY